jgi:4-hydroxybenzoate polyprenyltransferase
LRISLIAVFYIFIQVLVIMPVLMPLHILYSPNTIAKTSMLRASVSSLVETTGDKWLWVHSILIWWSSILWLATALWIVWGGIGYRKREVERLRARQRMQAKEVEEDPEGAKQFRSLMVLNIPPDSTSDF